MTPGGLQVTEFAAVQDQVVPVEQLVLAAAGHARHLTTRAGQKLGWVSRYVGKGHFRQTVEVVKDHRLEEVPEFRVEFYLSQPPFRLQWIVDEQTVLRADGVVLQLRDRAGLVALLTELRGWLSPDHVNLGIHRATGADEFAYPSVRAFEEEIVWRLYRLWETARRQRAG